MRRKVFFQEPQLLDYVNRSKKSQKAHLIDSSANRGSSLALLNSNVIRIIDDLGLY